MPTTQCRAHVLESDRSRLLSADRFSPQATEHAVVERVGGEEEKLRYAVAGVEEAFLCSETPGARARAAKCCWEMAWQRGFFDAVLYEGEGILDLHPHMSVFVMPADPVLVPVAVKRKQELLRAPCEAHLKYVVSAEGEAKLEEEGSDVSLADDSDFDLQEVQEEAFIASFEIPDEPGAKLVEWAKEGVPVMGELSELREELADLPWPEWW